MNYSWRWSQSVQKIKIKTNEKDNFRNQILKKQIKIKYWPLQLSSVGIAGKSVIFGFRFEQGSCYRTH